MASSKAMVNSTLGLRFWALLLLAASVVVLVTDKFVFSDGSKITFKDVYAYRYVIAAGIAGFAYTLIQIPFAIYHSWTEERMIRNKCMPEFDFYGDKIIALLLGTGVGAGFAVSFELKKQLHDFIDALDNLGGQGTEPTDEFESKLDKFLDRANIATGMLFLAFLCMAILSILSSISRTTSKETPTRRGFFFG